MPGRHVTEQSTAMYVDLRKNQGLSQAAAAAKAGISERTARRIDCREGKPLPKRERRTYRTRRNPFAAVWDDVIVPLLKGQDGDKLQAKTILEKLQADYPEQYPQNLLRTLQRHVKKWRVLHGPGREVMFPQREVPGRMGLSDFTCCNQLGVTIAGESFDHVLYHFRLAYSGWFCAMVHVGGESFSALSQGLTAALEAVGGAPRIHRTDSLSAAFKNLDRKAQKDQTQAYAELCKDLGMEPTRCNPGKSHENGAVESPHGHLKTAIEQALILRGHRDFDSREAYESFVQQIIAKRLAALDPVRLETEKQALQPLPDVPRHPIQNAQEHHAQVTSHATMVVNKTLYTVPDRYIGQKLTVYTDHDSVRCYFENELVLVLEARPRTGDQRQRVIDYRHVIDWLTRKPGAFPRLSYKDDLHPNASWQRMWSHLSKKLPEAEACRLYLGMLHLAHHGTCERALTSVIDGHLAQDTIPSLKELQDRYSPIPHADFPPMLIVINDAACYDQLLKSTFAAQQDG